MPWTHDAVAKGLVASTSLHTLEGETVRSQLRSVQPIFPSPFASIMGWKTLVPVVLNTHPIFTSPSASMLPWKTLPPVV